MRRFPYTLPQGSHKPLKDQAQRLKTTIHYKVGQHYGIHAKTNTQFHKPNRREENKATIPCVFEIMADKVITASRPDLVVIDKRNIGRTDDRSGNI